MRTRKKHYLKLACLLLLSGCCVHEFPQENGERVPFELNLDFSTELPLYLEIDATKNNGESKGPGESHDLRYIIQAYRHDYRDENSRIADTTFIFTRSEYKNLNYRAPLMLPEGDYTFRVWSDYVAANTQTDKYYDTRDFSEIILSSRDPHEGTNDYRDAFRGYAEATVLNPNEYSEEEAATIENRATASMVRPLGKFQFISTDIQIFIQRIIEMMKEQGMSSDEATMQNIDLNDYRIVFRYNAFMPCSYNIFTDKPADAWTGISFESRMETLSETEVSLGYDYVFVNGSESTLSLTVEVYDKDGKKMSSSQPIQVPVVRSKLTVVRGEFLTSEASGGVSINPGYDGDDYNVEIL